MQGGNVTDLHGLFGSVGGMFRDAARSNSSAIALYDGAAEVTYRDLDATVNRLAQAMIASGVGHGDRVAILSENSIPYVTILLACARIGAIAACLNWRQSANEVAHCFDLTEPKMIFVSERFAGLLPESMSFAPQMISIETEFKGFLEKGTEDAPHVQVSSEDGLLILFTSGTTGRPKAPVISHRAMIARGLLMRADWEMRRTDGFIAWSPLSHMAAADPTLSALMQGASVSILPEFDPDGIVDALTRHPVGWMVLMPGMIERLAEALERRNAPLQRVAAAGCMANLVPEDQIRRISKLLHAPFLNSFGSSETGISPASGNWINPEDELGALAKLQNSSCEIRLTDEDGAEVAEGRVGEIWLRSPTLFSGYWGDEAATATAFRGGWYHMGDDFRRDDAGALHFADRSKYLIKSGGENIYPAEIELVLRNLTGIADAVVVRRRDALWGEVPIAFVVASPDGAPCEADIRDALAQKIARFKIPKEFHVIGEHQIERNATGKIRRDLLEKRAEQEHNRKDQN
jgi:fatty-acyl-CoA synthase